jgi:endonuclease YncB( thermonuclease family)
MTRNFILLLILAFAILSCSNSNDSDYNDINPIKASIATVTCDYVTDGDTWNFLYNEEKHTVRVLHVDCFETYPGERLERQAESYGISTDSAMRLGKLAKEFADSLMTGKEVVMMEDPGEDSFDIYDRLLRITIIDGMRLDSLMIEKGYGMPY